MIDENDPVTWYEVVRFWYLVRVKHRLSPLALRLCRWLDIPSPYYGGVPAGLELDDLECEMDRLGVPRSVPCPDGSPWPLAPRQRLRMVESVVLRG